MRKHIHVESFESSKERLFELLITPSAICSWWGASRAIVIAEPNGIWTAAWGDDEDNPEYVTSFLIEEFEPPRRIVFADARYRASEGGLPFEADFRTEFSVEEGTDGTLLKVTQDGFPDGSEADEYYAACEKGWVDTFAGIRTFLEAADE